MIRLWRPERKRPGRAPVVLLLTAALLAFSSVGSARERTLIELFQSSDLVVRAKVVEVESSSLSGILAAVTDVRDVLMGPGKKGRLRVVEEKIFPSDTPCLRKGREVLLFLVSLPDLSRWKEHRAGGVDFMLLPGQTGIQEMGPSERKEAWDFLGAYRLYSPESRDESGQREYFKFLLRSLQSPVHAVQEASAAAFPNLHTPPIPLHLEDWMILKDFVLNREGNLAARIRLVEKLSGTEALVTLAPELVREHPELRLVTLQAMRSSGGRTLVDSDTLETILGDPDPRVRDEALNMLSRTSGIESDQKIGEVSLHDPSPEIRARALAILSDRGLKANRRFLSRGLDDESPYVVYQAAEGLRSIGDQDSASELGRLLESENPKARFVGVLMLGSMEGEPARHILQQSSEEHRDPQVRELCRKVLEGGASDPLSVRKLLGIEGRVAE